MQFEIYLNYQSKHVFICGGARSRPRGEDFKQGYVPECIIYGS